VRRVRRQFDDGESWDFLKTLLESALTDKKAEKKKTGDVVLPPLLSVETQLIPEVVYRATSKDRQRKRRRKTKGGGPTTWRDFEGGTTHQEDVDGMTVRPSLPPHLP